MLSKCQKQTLFDSEKILCTPNQPIGNIPAELIFPWEAHICEHSDQKFLPWPFSPRWQSPLLSRRKKFSPTTNTILGNRSSEPGSPTMANSSPTPSIPKMATESSKSKPPTAQKHTNLIAAQTSDSPKTPASSSPPSPLAGPKSKKPTIKKSPPPIDQRTAC